MHIYEISNKTTTENKGKSKMKSKTILEEIDLLVTSLTYIYEYDFQS